LSVNYYPPGEEAQELRRGDFLLTHGGYTTSRLIQFGQSLRYPPEYAYYNHAALVHTDDGWLAEALGSGVGTTHIDRYAPHEYTLVRIEASEEDRVQIARFATAVVAARWQYGWLTVIGAALAGLTGSSLVIGKVGTAICSGFVAEALTRAGYVFAKPPAYMAPADLAMYFDIQGAI
jgi:hypothetical protein